MKAILLADRNGSELQPLTQKTCVALLPITTKPLIDYTLDTFSLTGINEVIVVISAHAEYVERHLGNGERWGMQFHYVLSRGQEKPATVLARLGTQLSDLEYLLVRVDLLRCIDLQDFLTQAQALEGQIVATINGYNAGVCLLRKQTGANPWQNSNLLCFPLNLPIAKAGSQSKAFHTLTVTGNLSLLDSIKAYHHANLMVLAGHFPTLVLPPLRQAHEKLRIGSYSVVPEHNAGLVGAFCRVHAKATLLGDVVLCDKVLIDRYAKLSATIVLPCTYIGEAVELHNVIVWDNLLIRVDTGAVIQIFDSLIIANFDAQIFPARLAGVFNRSLGLLIFLISLPLWPLALLAALVENPHKPLRKIKLRGNLKKKEQVGVVLDSQEFTALEWATSIVLLRHLPKLFAVISGQLRMVGVSPETPEQADVRTAAWEKVRDCAPVGLIGPSQLTVPANAPIEECLIVEAHYARTRHFIIDTWWLLRGFLTCFTKRAWLRGQP